MVIMMMLNVMTDEDYDDGDYGDDEDYGDDADYGDGDYTGYDDIMFNREPLFSTLT